MRDLCEKNYLELNLEDAAALGIGDGDIVRIANPTGDIMEGEAMVRAGIARGTFGVAFGYGHRAYGTQDREVDGTLAKGDPAIGAGIHLQTMLDPTLEEGVIYPHGRQRCRLARPQRLNVPDREGIGGSDHEHLNEAFRHADRPIPLHRLQRVRRRLQAGERRAAHEVQHLGGKLTWEPASRLAAPTNRSCATIAPMPLA